MVDHEKLVATFDVPGFAVNRAGQALLAGSALPATVQKTLTEVGLPRGIGVDVILDSLRDDGPFMKEIAAGRPDQDHRLLRIGYGVGQEEILLDGFTGEIFVRHGDQVRLVSSSLDSFIEFLYLIQLMVNEKPGRRWASDKEAHQLGSVMMARLTEREPSIMADAADWWEELFHQSY